MHRRALHLAREAEAHFECALAVAGLAFAEVEVRSNDTDRRLARLAPAAADLADSPLARIEVLRARAAERRAAAEADASRRDSLGERAQADLRDALTIALQIGSILRQGHIERDVAAVLATLGRPGRADARRTRARRLLEEGDRRR